MGGSYTNSLIYLVNIEALLSVGIVKAHGDQYRPSIKNY